MLILELINNSRFVTVGTHTGGATKTVYPTHISLILVEKRKNSTELGGKPEVNLFYSRGIINPSLGQRFGDRFLGQRFVGRFLGQRFGDRFLGQRFGDRFLGQRFGDRFLGQRFGDRFLGHEVW